MLRATDKARRSHLRSVKSDVHVAESGGSKSDPNWKVFADMVSRFAAERAAHPEPEPIEPDRLFLLLENTREFCGLPRFCEDSDADIDEGSDDCDDD